MTSQDIQSWSNGFDDNTSDDIIFDQKKHLQQDRPGAASAENDDPNDTQLEVEVDDSYIQEERELVARDIQILTSGDSIRITTNSTMQKEAWMLLHKIEVDVHEGKTSIDHFIEISILERLSQYQSIDPIKDMQTIINDALERAARFKLYISDNMNSNDSFMTQLYWRSFARFQRKNYLTRAFKH